MQLFMGKTPLLSAKIYEILGQSSSRITLKLENGKQYTLQHSKVCELNKNSSSFSEYEQYRQKQGQEDREQIKFQFKYRILQHKIGLQFDKEKSYQIEIKSDVPIGKCLGSSATFNTVLATAFLYLGVDPQEISLEKVNMLSRELQKVQHGTPSGIDNFVSTYGGMVLFNKSKEPNFQKIDDPMVMKNLNQEMNFYLIDSQVEKNTKTAVETVRAHYDSNSKYHDMVGEIGTFAMRLLKLLQKPLNGNQEQQKLQILNIVALNHQYLRQLGVSIPEIQQIVRNWTIKNEQSVKITGAGMGGYVLVVCIAKEPKVEAQSSALKIRFDKKGLRLTDENGLEIKLL